MEHPQTYFGVYFPNAADIGDGEYFPAPIYFIGKNIDSPGGWLKKGVVSFVGFNDDSAINPIFARLLAGELFAENDRIWGGLPKKKTDDGGLEIDWDACFGADEWRELTLERLHEWASRLFFDYCQTNGFCPPAENADEDKQSDDEYIEYVLFRKLAKSRIVELAFIAAAKTAGGNKQ